jgi:hypothetical protein
MNTINLTEHTNGPDNWTSPCNRSKGDYFFRKKPRLGINKPIARFPIQLTVAWRKRNDELLNPKIFNANIWVLEINNTRLSKISTTAAKCYATLHIRDLGADIPLRWRTFTTEPKECITGEEPREGEPPLAQYHRLMPYYYALTLAQRHTAPTMSIHFGEKYGLYFLFTYEGSNRAFIITPLETPQLYENELFCCNVNGMFLFFNEGEEREMTIKVESNPRANQNNADINDIKFRIKFNSWDNVEIH